MPQLNSVIEQCEAECEVATTLNRNLMVPWLLMGAYAYDQGDPIMSDAFYDGLARRLASEWDKVEHIHKHLITPPAPDDITKFCHVMMRPDEYPSRVEGAVYQLRKFATELAQVSQVPLDSTEYESMFPV